MQVVDDFGDQVTKTAQRVLRIVERRKSAAAG